MVFDKFSDEHLEELRDLYRVNEFKKNQIIESAHSTPKDVHFIISGGIKRVLKKSKTREHIFEISYPDSLDCFYIEWLSKVSSSTNLASISNDTLVISISLADWEQILSKHPQLREKFIAYLFAKHQKIENRLITQLLSISSEERYHTAIKDFPKLKWELTKKEIGAYIGVAPETISRLLSQTLPKII
ncbi:Crp/Fnr family transcriptional regulator [Polynucleobacter corsicus]|uniref:Crp/Fnr family transcriptional regulator n=1 Tax=Polynucleobacter corsicus TaxID=2081042 RepID=UPI001BFDAB3A|nr:Crp/Fnr family transcriptional regulator [Polynucleobacter corsicus]QWE18648.1 Crp/Fnr family transcriptional regulator [Polynucleobacter corsicus]